MGLPRLMFRTLAVAGVGGCIAISARRAAEQRAAERFYDLSLDHTEPGAFGTGYGGCPFVFHRVDSFQSLHAASLDAVQKALPSTELHPVQLQRDKAAVFIGAVQYGDITANGVDGLAGVPYGEVMVAIPVTRRPAPPFLPLIAPPATGISAGAFVLHLPVTTRVARDAGRTLWGLPKFVADMDFEESTVERRVHVAEGDRTILTLRVRPSGRPSITTNRFVLYSVLERDLIETALPAHGLRQLRWGSRGGHLELGDHQVADELRELGISPEPFVSAVVTAERMAMTLGRPVGTASTYLGYIGEDRDLGRYVVRYPHTGPIDRYAPFAPTAGPGAPLATRSQQEVVAAPAMAA